MSDRVALPPIPGLLTNYVDVDLFAGYFALQQTLAEFQPAVTEAPSGGSLSVSLNTAIDGGGDGLDAVIPDGATTPAAPVTGAVNVPAATTLYLRITAESGSPANFYGYFYVDAAAGVASALTTLSRVKAFKSISGSDNDVLINQLILGVSVAMQSYMRRNILTVAITAEKHDANGLQDSIILDEYPILSSPEVVIRYNGTVVDTDTYAVDDAAGEVIQVQSGVGTPWAAGRLAYEADYWAGYEQVPEDLAAIATKQVVHELLQTAAGESRLSLRGVVLDPGGDAQYMTGAWVPGAERVMNFYRNLRLF